MAKITIKRVCAGEYEATDGVNVVAISKQDFGYGDEWMARAVGLAYVYSDPMATKRQAVEAATHILQNWKKLAAA